MSKADIMQQYADWKDVEKEVEADIAEAREKLAEDAKKHDSIAVVSGGMDSTTLVYHMLNSGLRPHCLSFDYGQRHKKELFWAQMTAQQLGLRHTVVDLTGLTHLISNSALTGGKDVPDGHYAEDNMKATVVPNRNMIMLSIAAGIAVNNGYKWIATGVHAGDHFIYPDCRPSFIDSVASAIMNGNKGFHKFDHGLGPMYTPFLQASKADIAFRALELGVPLHQTWSCYKGGDIHCGKCGTCVERLEAIDAAMKYYSQYQGHTVLEDGISPNVRLLDQTQYADTEYWKTAESRLTK
jgi:7-cyano-7-deazaguanine synthase